MPGALYRRPKSCAGLRKCLIPKHCRLYSLEAQKSNALGPTEQEGHQSFRVRKDGSRLPLPPLLDPVVLSERSRWEQTKAQPRVTAFTKFQKKLWENPYAHALASPARECRALNILLPSALLVSLHTRPHPETSEPWLVPLNLTTTASGLGIPYRFSGRRLVAGYLNQKGNWKSGLHYRMTNKLGTKATAKIVWREDMPDLILELLRKNLVSKLKWYFERAGRLVACKSPRREDIEEIDNVSCVLYFGSLKTRADRFQEDALAVADETEDCRGEWTRKVKKALDPHKAEAVTHHAPIWWRGPLIPTLQPRLRYPPLEFPMTEWKGSQLAVYSLYDLLGAEKMQDLVQGSKYEGRRCVALKTGRHNVPVELLLLQLQAFLAVPGPCATK